MRAGESLPHRESGNMSTTWASIFSHSCPGSLDTCFPAISWGGRGRAWGNPGKASGWAGSLKVRPHPPRTAGKGKWALAVRTLLPPLMRWELPGECSLWNSALFWPSSALGLDSGRGAGQELLGKGCPQGSVPSTSHLPARSALLLAAPVSSQAGPKVKAAG